MASRDQNERKFGEWIDLPDGGRRYWFDVAGHRGWRARYLKTVDAGKLVEIHLKFPVDEGHQKA